MKRLVVSDGIERQEDCTLVPLENSLQPIGIAQFLLWTPEAFSNNSQCFSAFFYSKTRSWTHNRNPESISKRAEEGLAMDSLSQELK